MKNYWCMWVNKSREEKTHAIGNAIYIIIAIVTFFTFPWAESFSNPTTIGGWLMCFAIKALASAFWPIIWFCNIMTWKI